MTNGATTNPTDVTNVSIINAAIAAGSRRLLQDNLVYNNARSQDIGRVQAMAASGLLPKDASGNVQLPPQLLEALWRPFPGSSSVTNATIVNDSQPAQSGPSAAPVNTVPASPGPVSSPWPSVPPAASSPVATAQKVAAGLPWAKMIALAAALAGGGGLGVLLARPALPIVTQPAAPVVQPTAPAGPLSADETQYELHLGMPKGAANG